MPLIDDRGRLFGRMNLIDAALLVFVLALLPLGVFAFRVFRVSPPRIDTVQPASQPAGPARRLRVKGANFRPYLRVFVNRTGEPFSLTGRNPDVTEGRFLIESPAEVEILLPPVAPGSYDLHVFDETRQVLAHPAAFAIEPPMSVPLSVTVRFVVLPDVAALVKPGDADLGDTAPSPPSPPSPNEARAVIRTLATSAETLSAVDSHVLPSRRGTLGVAGPVRTLDARLTVPALQNGSGVWIYRDQPIRPGDAIAFETSTYSMRGLIVAVAMADPERDAAVEGRSKP